MLKLSRGAAVVATGTTDDAGRLTGLGAALKVDIATVLPLEQAADGLATIASGRARGKIVVKVSD